MDNTVNDLPHKIKFKNREKNKNNFFIKQKSDFLFYSWKSIFLRFLRIQLSLHSFFFFAKPDTKNIDMPRQKPPHLPTAEANFERCNVRKGSST